MKKFTSLQYSFLSVTCLVIGAFLLGALAWQSSIRASELFSTPAPDYSKFLYYDIWGNKLKGPIPYAEYFFAQRRSDLQSQALDKLSCPAEGIHPTVTLADLSLPESLDMKRESQVDNSYFSILGIGDIDKDGRNEAVIGADYGGNHRFIDYWVITCHPERARFLMYAPNSMENITVAFKPGLLIVNSQSFEDYRQIIYSYHPEKQYQPMERVSDIMKRCPTRTESCI